MPETQNHTRQYQQMKMVGNNDINVFPEKKAKGPQPVKKQQQTQILRV